MKHKGRGDLQSPPPTLEQSQEMFRKLSHFAEAMLRHQKLDELLWDMVQLIGELLGLDDCVIYLVKNQTLIQTAAYGIKNPGQRTIIAPIIIPIGEGIVGMVAQTRIPEIVSDTRLDDRYISDQFDGFSELTVPIVFQDKVIGILDSEAPRTHAFTQDDLVLLEAISHVAAGHIARFQEEHRRNKSTETDQDERLESLERLAGGVAHDFNNLLTIMGLNLEIAAWTDDEQERRECSETALTAVKQARGLTRQLMTFARGNSSLHEEVYLTQIIEGCLEVFATHDLLTVRHDGIKDLPTVWGDPSQLTQVIQNLLLNAAEAVNFTGNIQISTYTKSGASGQSVVLSVQDDGHGLPPQHLSRVFDPYFSTKATGTGLGLSTAYWIARRHQGEVTAQNLESGGARFSFKLPALRVRVAHSPGPARKIQKELHILVLVHEKSLASGLCRVLGQAGHQSLSIREASQVTHVWLQQEQAGTPFDLAILDLQGPGGSRGREVLARLRAISPGARIIAMSGYSEDNVLVKPQEYGFNARLKKPFIGQELQEALSTAMTTLLEPEPNPPPAG